MWYDEAVSYLISRLPIREMLVATAADNHPPLYYLLIHQADQWQARAVSMLAFVLSWPLVYILARRTGNAKSAFWGSLFFLVSPIHFYFASQIRMYSLVVLLHLLLVNCWIRKKWAFYILIAAAGLYTHYYFGVALITIGLLDARTWSKNLVAGLLFLPWLGYALKFPHPDPWTFPLYVAIPATFLSFTLGGLGSTTLRTFLGTTVPLVFRILAVSTSGWMFSVFVASRHKLVKLLISGFLISLPVFSPRALIIYSPIYLICIAARLSQAKAAGLLLLLIVVNVYFYRMVPDQWNGSLAALGKQIYSLPQSVAITHTSPYTYYPLVSTDSDHDHFLETSPGLTNITAGLINTKIAIPMVLLGRYSQVYRVETDSIANPATVDLQLYE